MKIRFFGNSKGIMTSVAAGILSLAILSTSCAQTNTRKADTPAGSPVPAADQRDVTNATPALTNAAAVPAPAPTASAQPVPALELPADLSPGLAEIIKLAQAKVGDDVILAYIKNTRMRYRPSADEIVYLNDIGISDKVITALLEHGKAMADEAAAEPTIAEEPQPAPAPEPTLTNAPAPSYSVTAETNAAPPPPAPPGTPAPQASVAPPPQQVTVNYFYDSLSPYGVWVDVPGYGRCWRPSVVAVNPGWQPYWDRGRWIYTDCGWYWQSDYSWGWATFHYGRWHHHSHHGWVWCPDVVWAPAWVCWRNYDTYCGWAPLPPSARWTVGVGFVSGHVGVGFGLEVGLFRFIHYDHITHHYPCHYGVPHHQAVNIYNHSTVVNNYVVKNTTIINNGVAVDRVSAVTHKPVEKVVLRDVSGAPHFKPDARVDRVDTKSRTLNVYRPNVAAAAAQPIQTTAQHKPILVNKSSAMAAPQRNSLASAPRPTAPVSRLSDANRVSGVQKPTAATPSAAKPISVQRSQMVETPSAAKPASAQPAPRQKTSAAQPQISAPVQRSVKESSPAASTRHPAVTGSTHPAADVKSPIATARQAQPVSTPKALPTTGSPSALKPSRSTAWPGSNLSQPANSQSARQVQAPAQSIQPRVSQQPSSSFRPQSPHSISESPRMPSQSRAVAPPSRMTPSAPVAPASPSSSTRAIAPSFSSRPSESGASVQSIRPEIGGSSSARPFGSSQSSPRFERHR